MVRAVGDLPSTAEGRFEGVAVSRTTPVRGRPSIVDIGPQYDLSTIITIYLKDKG